MNDVDVESVDLGALILFWSNIYIAYTMSKKFTKSYISYDVNPWPYGIWSILVPFNEQKPYFVGGDIESQH
jgi:hypothetical protein